MGAVATEGGMSFQGWGKRAAIGEKKRTMVRTEEGYYPTWEQLLNLHRCDYWHCTVAQRSQAGFPDYVVLGEGWLAFVELKARSLTTNRAGKVSPAQLRYKQAIETAGAEWVIFLLPDEWHDIDVWLNAKTGKGIWGAWQL